MFLINRCDETEVNIEECKKEYESLFEINKREKIWNDIISKSEILKNADNINVTKFSNKLYNEFLVFKKGVNNFYAFISSYEKKIDKNAFQGKKYLLYLKKKFMQKYVQSQQKNIRVIISYLKILIILQTFLKIIYQKMKI